MSDATLLAALEPYAGSAYNIPGRFDSQAAVNLIRYYQRQYDAAVGGLGLTDDDIAYGIRATGDWHVAHFNYPGAYNGGRFDQSSNLAYVAANSILSALVLTEQTPDGTAGPKRRKFQELTQADVQAGNVTSAVIADRIKAQQGAIWRASNPDLGGTGFGAVIGDLLSNPVVQVGLALTFSGFPEAFGSEALSGEVVAGDFGSSEILAASSVPDAAVAVAGDFGSSEILAASSAAPDVSVSNLAALDSGYSGYAPQPIGGTSVDGFFDDWGVVDAPKEVDLSYWSSDPGADPFATTESVNTGWTPSGGYPGSSYGQASLPQSLNDIFGKATQIIRGVSSAASALTGATRQSANTQTRQQGASGIAGATRQSANTQTRQQGASGIAGMNLGLPLLALAGWLVWKG